jgi:hypothetical protein
MSNRARRRKVWQREYGCVTFTVHCVPDRTASNPRRVTDNGYEDSLMRWLLNFNPAARLGEFLAG